MTTFFHPKSRRSNSLLSQQLRSVLSGSPLPCPIPEDPNSFDGMPFLPLSDYRYNYSYPFLLHKDCRRLQVRAPQIEPLTLDAAANLAAFAESQARLTSGSPVVQGSPFRVVRNLDFLKVSFHLEWDLNVNSFLDILDMMKKKVQDTEKDSIPVFKENGFDWNLYRTGTPKYSFRIKSGDVTLMFSRRKASHDIPNCRLEIGSLSCWSPGFFAIYERAKTFLAVYGAKIVKETVSEAHLAADFIGTDIKAVDLSDQSKWIAKARDFNPHDKIPVHRGRDPEPEPDELDFNPHYTNRRFTGLDIGKGNLMLRVYDKVTELKRTRAIHKQQIFSEIWGMKQYDDQSVTRVEYQVRRPKLREFADSEDKRIDTVADLAGALRSLWAYLTTEWTRHTSNPVNRNHNQGKA
ncbi:hypothetical protein, partial [Desulfobulbus sp.]|uniref:hypothetical protein n=1 Tax=Desulfobulbus sp. TaxID=895 RepID=UPI0027BA0349